jgi:hypothetical protein
MRNVTCDPQLSNGTPTLRVDDTFRYPFTILVSQFLNQLPIL